MPNRGERHESRRTLLKKGGIVASTISIAGCATQFNGGENSTPTDISSTNQDSGDTTGSTATSADDVTLHGFEPWNVLPADEEYRDAWGTITLEYHNIGEYPSISNIPLNKTNPDEILSDVGHFATFYDFGIGMRWGVNEDEQLDLIKTDYDDNSRYAPHSWEETETVGDYTLHELQNQEGSPITLVAIKPNTVLKPVNAHRITEYGFRSSLDSEPIAKVDSLTSTVLERFPERMHLEIKQWQQIAEIEETNTKHSVIASGIDYDIDSGVVEQIRLTYLMRLETGDPNAIFDAIKSKELVLSGVTRAIDTDRASDFKRTIQNMSVDGDFVIVEASYERSPQESLQTFSGEAAQMARQYDPLSFMPVIEDRSDDDFVRPWYVACNYAPLNDYVSVLNDLNVTLSEMDTNFATPAISGGFGCGSLGGQNESISGIFNFYTDFNDDKFLEDFPSENQGTIGEYDLYTIGESPSDGIAVSSTGFLYQDSNTPIEQTLLNLRTQVKTINENAPSAEKDTQVSQLQTIAEGNLAESYDRSGQSNSKFWTARMNTISAVNDTTVRFQTAYSLVADSNPSREALIQEETLLTYKEPRLTQENGIALLEEVRSLED